MLLLLFALFMFLLIGLDFSDYKPFALYCIIAVILTVVGLEHLVLLSKAIRKDAKDKDLSSGTIWSIFTFLTGLPCWIVYALFTFRAGKNKSNRKNPKTLLVSIFLLAVFISGSYILLDSSRKYAEAHFSTNIVTYKNSDGADVVYDKMGNTYTFDEIEDFKYYDRDGNSYSADNHYEIFSDIPETDALKCIETETEYNMYDFYDCYIDEEGYLAIFSLDGEVVNSKEKYQSDDGFYNLGFCSWSPDGNLIFSDMEYAESSGKYIYKDILENTSF